MRGFVDFSVSYRKEGKTLIILFKLTRDIQR